MGEDAVSAPASRRDWTDAVSGEDRSDIQALLARGLGWLPCSRALFVDFCDAPAVLVRHWLAHLADHVCSVAAAPLRPDRCVQVALSAAGMALLRPDVPLDGFDVAWRMGMGHPMRRRLLGDELPGAWLANRRRWRGTADTGEDVAFVAHALVLLYAADIGKLGALDLAIGPPPPGARVQRLDTRIDAAADDCARQSGSSEKQPAREHFGFVDGISQPIHFAKGIDTAPSQWNSAALGDLLIGHTDTYGSCCVDPVVPAGLPGAGYLWPAAPGLASLGRNGTYLVARQLYQDVAGFWGDMAVEAGRLNVVRHPEQPPFDAATLAHKVVGRTMDGRVLRPAGSEAGNEFGFAEADPYGHGCPLGAHIRRANPRDAGARIKGSAASRATSLEAVNNHRILRRGRAFGPWVAFERGSDPPSPPDGEERGLLFLALGSDIERQFELIQQTWMLAPDFASLGGETDPLAGPDGRFSVQMRPAALRASVKRYVQLIGGDYYFMPGLKALRFLAGHPA
jgi:deferrochelatase/peroxidase EfeB